MCLTRLHLSEVTASSPATLTGEARWQRCIVNPQTAALNTKQPDNLPWLSTLHSIFTVFFSFKKNKTKKHSATLPSGGELSDLQLSQSLQNGSERSVSYLRCFIRKQILTKKKRLNKKGKVQLVCEKNNSKLSERNVDSDKVTFK